MLFDHEIYDKKPSWHECVACLVALLISGVIILSAVSCSTKCEVMCKKNGKTYTVITKGLCVESHRKLLEPFCRMELRK